MMDQSNLSLADGLEEVHQNGFHEELSNSGKNAVVSNVDPGVAEIVETSATDGNFENFNLNQLDGTATDSSPKSEIKDGSNDNVDGNNVTISKEEELEIIQQAEQLKIQRGPLKNKNAKPTSLRGVNASSVKKSTNGIVEEVASAISNGTSSFESHPREPLKKRSISDKQTQSSKHPVKSNAAPSEASMEKTKPRSLKKGPIDDNLQGEAESSTPATEHAKPRRVGALPNYGFSFKCDERAERRKEFYTKLGEKIHAKEVEESNLQAKTKESQEAEIKMLRKSLGFKATPMPSFYQEPPPPRVELKKMPTTRAKSPKLGRRKNSTNSEPEGGASGGAQQGRLSLDEKVLLSNPTKGTTPVPQKKPLRRSLPPRLTPEKRSSLNSGATQTSSKLVNGEKTSLSSVKNEVTTFSNSVGEEKVEMAAALEATGEAKSPVNGEIVIEEKPQLALVQEAIAAEH